MHRIVSLLRNSKGRSLVKYTLLLLVVVLVGSASDLSLVLFASHVAHTAAREGAQQAAALPIPCTGSPNGKTTAENKVRISPLFNSFTATCSGPTPNPNTGQREVTVTVSGPYTFSFLQFIGFTTPLTITGSATMRYEWPS